MQLVRSSPVVAHPPLGPGWPCCPRFAPGLVGLCLAAPLLLSLVPAPAVASAGDRPVGVAPGSPGRPTPARACPGFSWGGVEGAVGYEVVVYRIESPTEDFLGPGELESRPALAERIEAAALSWEPPLDRCLDPAESYAWSVRAVTPAGETAWSDPLLFRVAEAQGGGPASGNVPSGFSAIPGSAHAGSAPLARVEPTGGSDPPPVRERTVQIPPTPIFSGGGPALSRVRGEIRTVDAGGAPRLWGQGRLGAVAYGRSDGTGLFCANGSIRFGLSGVLVDWPGAAAACPAGSWVCQESEIADGLPCDTGRPDSTLWDWSTCSGAPENFESSRHLGWLANTDVTVAGKVCGEFGGCGFSETCTSLPVWCCWQ